MERLVDSNSVDIKTGASAPSDGDPLLEEEDILCPDDLPPNLKPEKHATEALLGL